MQSEPGGTPRVGNVDFGDFRRTRPIGQDFGRERGRPVDRYYIEAFLQREAHLVRGSVLELGDSSYTRRYGGSHVSRSDVLNLTPDNEQATLIGDLTRDNDLPSDAFDCIIFTQALQFMYDVQAAVTTLHRMLKPAGVLLTTVPGISQISRWDMDRWGDYWRFTTDSMRKLLQGIFGPDAILVEPHGNVLAATAFLHGLAAEELTPAEFNVVDEDYQLLITARAVKQGPA